MKRSILPAAVGLLTLVSLTFPAVGSETAYPREQTLCPVMEGNRIDREIYVDYQGKRVYFCCNACKGAFEKEPRKYLDRLPQFQDADSGVATAEHSHDRDSHAQSTGPRLYRFTEPLGVATFSLLLLTACLGLFRRRLKRRFLPIHRTLALTTIVVAVMHALTVLLGH